MSDANLSLGEVARRVAEALCNSGIVMSHDGMGTGFVSSILVEAIEADRRDDLSEWCRRRISDVRLEFRKELASGPSGKTSEDEMSPPRPATKTGDAA